VPKKLTFYVKNCTRHNSYKVVAFWRFSTPWALRATFFIPGEGGSKMFLINIFPWYKKSRQVHFAYELLAYVSFAYKIGKMKQNISCILPMGQSAYVPSGLRNFCRQNQHFPGNHVCILPTGSWPMCHFAYKIGKFIHPGVICFRKIS
jgi:hypothetical protein